MRVPIIPILIIAAGLGTGFEVAAQTPDEPPPLDEQPDADDDVQLMQPADIALSQEELDEEEEEETPEVTLDGFKRVLSPHGRWVSTPEYGLVWIPAVDPLWRPYTNGEWVYTSAGWTFVAYEPWGWAPFHYGRWVYKRRFGWCWIPGYRWAPAWVTWRYGGGYVAWAPLGPAGVTVSYYSTPSLWIAVHTNHFRRPLTRRLFVPTRRIDVVFRTTKFAGVHRHRVIPGPSTTYIRRATGRPIRRIARHRAAPRWVAKGTFRSPVVHHRRRGAPAVRRRGAPAVRRRGVAPTIKRRRGAPGVKPRHVPPARRHVKPSKKAKKKRRIDRRRRAPRRVKRGRGARGKR